MTEIKIIPVTAENAACAGQIIYTSWGETYRGLIPKEVLDSRSLKKCTEHALLNPQNYLLALVDGEPAGTVAFLPEASDYCTHCEGGEIVALYVLKKFQRRGVGKALFNAAAEIIGKNEITLFVLKGNGNAIGFYSKMGFRFTGDYFEDTDHGIIEYEMYKGLY